METKAKLRQFLEQQQKFIAEYEQLVHQYETSDLVSANEQLKNDLKAANEELIKLRQENQRFGQENAGLKQALSEAMWDEKLNILKLSRQKLATYFGRDCQEYQDNLTALEAKTRQKLAQLKQTAAQNRVMLELDFAQSVQHLEADWEARVQAEDFRVRQAQQGIRQDVDSRYEQLKAIELTPEVIAKRVKQNQLEMKIGLDWINKIGILLILLGVGAAFQYTFVHWLNDYWKGAFFFLLGGVFLGGGEWFYRQKKEVFSLGLLGGGLAILYLSVFYSYFALQIIDLNVALFLAVLITLTSVVLSLRYNSQIVGSLSLVGGYLPFLTFMVVFGMKTHLYPAAMAYLLVLNLLLLGVSYTKRWYFICYLGFLLNVPSLIYLVFHVEISVWGIGYATMMFLLYLGVVLAYPFKQQRGFKTADLILLGLNITVTATILYNLFGKAGFTSFRGLLLMVFGLFFLGLGRFVSRKLERETGALILFLVTALTFAVLVIPAQFGVVWLSMGWLVEAVLLIVFGIRHKLPLMEKAGWTIFLLCLSSFCLLEFLPVFFGVKEVRYFDFKYLAIVAGMVGVLASYFQPDVRQCLLIRSPKARWLDGFKYWLCLN